MKKKKMVWTPEKIKLLGSMSDARLAAELDTTHAIVRKQRIAQGIAPSVRQKAPKEWTKQDIALLGTMTDKQVAEKTGRTPAAVYIARRERNIPGARIAWPDHILDQLGKVADEDIAQELGCSAATVLNKRRSLGIPAARKRRTHHAPELAWADVEKLTQPEFFRAVRSALEKHWGRKVIYSDIAKITLYSLSRIQKWATPGSAQEPLAVTVRHHIWAATQLALLNLSDAKT
ncbi:hypothetical protein [Pseudomonas sp. LRF_L74]|uniref:hypothetical protein n=1 Tax=Pseudomonas sp. LRF_L74 TaxID=3369422 RepID=UPI003F604A35